MKKLLCFLLMLLVALPSLTAQRKKVGVVLGGGGQKVAHIGVLKVLRKLVFRSITWRVRVWAPLSAAYMPSGIRRRKSIRWSWSRTGRCCSATGSNETAFYLSGKGKLRTIYSFSAFGKDKKDRVIQGTIKGQNFLMNLFSNLTIGYHDSVDFRNFNIPFACVAVDAVDGKDYVFRKGSLPLAMRASMAIPAVFTPRPAG